MTARHICIVACVTYITTHNVVGVVQFFYLIVRIYADLEGVLSRFHVCDVNPLTIDVCVVGIITSWTQTLCVGCAGVSPVVSRVTGGVLQAEASLVALCHRLLSGGIQQFIVAKLVHAVVMLVAAMPLPGVAWSGGAEVSGALVLDSLRKPQQHSGVIVSRSVG